MSEQLRHGRQRTLNEPPSVVALIRAGHPGKAVALSIIWRMPWRTIAGAVVAIATGTRIVFPSLF